MFTTGVKKEQLHDREVMLFLFPCVFKPLKTDDYVASSGISSPRAYGEIGGAYFCSAPTKAA
jgi:hypothetical protein